MVTAIGNVALWRHTTRGLQAIVVSLAAVLVSLIFAAMAFFLLLILTAETNILPYGFGEDFPLVFFNAFPVALVAAILNCFSVLRKNARQINDVFSGWFAGLLLVLAAIALWISFWFGNDADQSGGSDLLLILGTLVPAIAVVAGNWASVRFFFWASGLRRL